MTKNLTEQELLAFVQAVEQHYDELFGRAKGSSLKKTKEDAWKNVVLECVAQGYRAFEDKTVSQLRDDIYGYRKRTVEKKWNNSQKTGGEGIIWKQVYFIFFRIILLIKFIVFSFFLICSGKKSSYEWKSSMKIY